MKTLPCFLTLLSFLLALGMGCAASRTSGVAKMTPLPLAKEPPGSMYEKLVGNSPLARQMREPVAIRFLCTLTGEFNISPEDDKLLMETVCIEENPPEDVRIATVQHDDTEATKEPGEHVFDIKFRDSTVSITDVAGQREVHLHYHNSSGAYHSILLTPHPKKRYRYSFIHIEDVNPIPIFVTLMVRR